MTIIFTILIALAWVSPAAAGTINFNLELQGDHCVVTNSGDSPVFYPVVYKLGSSRQWLPLKSDLQSAELPPGGALSLRLPRSGTTGSATANQPDLDSLQLLMIRFFDQAGVSFGQVALLRPPPQSRYNLKGTYAGGRLRLEAPPEDSGIRATSVLAPFEEGIRPLSGALSFTHHEPPATRIEWRRKQSADIGIGAASDVTLLHETADGVLLQTMQINRARKIEQRTAWLYKRRAFYLVGALCGLCGMLLCIVGPQIPRINTEKTGRY
ncbi:MAG: hypothetical protein PHH91_00015 [Desulfuromonadaceae bacterium]|nr:hypothetical protein [Desulfuromonadaceae bacterium]